MAANNTYPTMEDLASELGVTAWKVKQVARELGLERVILPGENRRRFRPEDAQKIKDRIAGKS